jgi:S-DNA-T family DNA segregation ATPase FtsK/SpoIIIE
MTDHTTPPENPLRSEELADVHYLPAAQPATEMAPAGEPLEGELVSEEEYQRRTSQKALALARYEAYRRDVTLVVRVMRTAVTHQRTKTTSKAVVRNAWYPVAGAGVVLKRWRDTHGASRYERMMRQAELAGDHEALLEWETRDVAEKQRRHQRVMDWLGSPLQLVKAGGIAVASLIALLLALGIILAVADGDIARVIEPITGVINAIRWIVWFVTVYGMLLVTGATAAVLAYLWHLGRTRTDAPPLGDARR